MWKICIAVLVFIMLGCASSGSTQQAVDLNEEELTLRNRLDQIGGVSIQGRYSNTKVYIRGESSMHSPGRQPLFVVDGRKMGRSFYRIASMFTPDQIVSVEVLSGAGANLYGSEGGQGVIVIKTNRGL